MDPEEFSPEEQAWMGSGQSLWYSYRCLICKHETEIEDIVVGSFVVIACPQCGGGCRSSTRRVRPQGVKC
jgi:DNA-directed RNA polymerase subunit RPC12/RpoP